MNAFTLEIRLDDDAMQTFEDVARALEDIADELRLYGFRRHAQSIHDVYGNRVGQHKLHEEN